MFQAQSIAGGWDRPSHSSNPAQRLSASRANHENAAGTFVVNCENVMIGPDYRLTVMR